jgi:hypothetical protein
MDQLDIGGNEPDINPFDGQSRHSVVIKRNFCKTRLPGMLVSLDSDRQSIVNTPKGERVPQQTHLKGGVPLFLDVNPEPMPLMFLDDPMIIQ